MGQGLDLVDHLPLGALRPENEPVVLRQVVGQGVGGAVGHQPALVHHDDALAHRLDLRQDVGAQNHRVVAAQVFDEGADLNEHAI